MTNIKYEDLVKKCVKYGGSGSIRETLDSKKITCKTCEGRGELMTASGQAMYKFVRFLKAKGLFS